MHADEVERHAVTGIGSARLTPAVALIISGIFDLIGPAIAGPPKFDDTPDKPETSSYPVTNDTTH